MKTLASTKPTRGGRKLAVQRDGHVVTSPPRRGRIHLQRMELERSGKRSGQRETEKENINIIIEVDKESDEEMVESK